MAPEQRKSFGGQSGGSRPQQSGNRPQFGGSRPQTGGARPQSSGTQRPGGFQQGSRPQTAGVRPAQSGTRPAQTGPRPQGQGGYQQRDRSQGPRQDARQVYINDMIKAPKVLLIDESGEKIGLISRDEALRRASSEGLDLVQLAYNPVDMVCTAKIVDYGKYMYDKQKDDKEKKKTQKSKGSKEIKMSYTIGDNDLALKMKKAIEFLEDGYSVRFSVRLKGRERIFVDKVVEKMQSVEQEMQDYGKSQGVKNEPSGISLFLLPKSK